MPPIETPPPTVAVRRTPKVAVLQASGIVESLLDVNQGQIFQAPTPVAAHQRPSGRSHSTRTDPINHHVTDPDQVADPDKPGHPRSHPAPQPPQPLAATLDTGPSSDKR